MVARNVLRWALLGFRKVLHSLPDEWRTQLRSQHRLMSFYSRALHTSHLFYGTLSKDKLQARYNALMPKQNMQLEALEKELDNRYRANCLVIVTEVTGLRQTLGSVEAAHRIETIFILNCTDTEVLVSQYTQTNLQLLNSADDMSYELPLIVMHSSERLHRFAVAGFLSTVNARSSYPSAVISEQPKLSAPLVITCDTDYINEHGLRSEPECYPNWDPDLQLSSGYIDTAIVVAGTSLQQALVDFVITTQHHRSVSLWLANLYFSDEQTNFKHVPLTLTHRSATRSIEWYDDLKASGLVGHWPVSIEFGKADNNVILQWPLDSNPLVSIIIPTRNSKELVQTCIESILEKTHYQNYEILLVDNQSDDPNALAYFKQLDQTQQKVRILDYPHAFNYAAINNHAVEQARGEILAFVNNDIEVITPEWLSCMVGHVRRHDVGCVGAKLFYPNRRIQHAGVVLGYGGGAGHAHKYFPDYHSGYLNRLACTNTYSAVTAACLLVLKSDFNAAGGFNAESLAVAFNDVDLCLKILSLGKRNVYCAEAQLFHHESVSRGSENTPEKRARFESELAYLKENWADYIQRDPAYNPNLTLRRENFALKE